AGPPRATPPAAAAARRARLPSTATNSPSPPWLSRLRSSYHNLSFVIVRWSFVTERPIHRRPAILEKAPRLLQRRHACQIARRHHDLLAVARLREHSAVGPRDEGAAPEGDGAFAADAIDGGDVDIVGRRVPDLHTAPHLLPVAGDVRLDRLVDH